MEPMTQTLSRRVIGLEHGRGRNVTTNGWCDWWSHLFSGLWLVLDAKQSLKKIPHLQVPVLEGL